jgi:SAM-dependent methyltransferase
MEDPKKASGTAIARERYIETAKHLREGRSHPTLGANLRTKEWWTAGQSKFSKITKLAPIAPSAHVVEYGCGTFRVGIQFIQFLDPGCYFGLDVTMDLIDVGKEKMGGDVMAAKAPRLAEIGDDTVAEAAAFGAKLVYSWAVSFHVHPDELGYYLASMAKIAHRPDAALIFNTKLADKEFQYGTSGWARPLADYVDGLRPLKLFAVHKAKPEAEDDKSAGATSALLEFRRS